MNSTNKLVLPFPEDVFIELMEIDTKSVSFSFNEVLLGFMKDNCLKSFLSPLFTGAMLMTLLLVLVHVARL